MLHRLYLMFATLSVINTEMVVPGIDRTMSEGVTSVGYKVVYGDEDLDVINEVVSDSEKLETFKKNSELNKLLPPLPSIDVKCLMSVDRYCSKDMGEMKSILIQALKDDCAKCTQEQKESAGKIVAAMMAHDPVAWKQFLTRSALEILPKKKPPKEVKHIFKQVGEPEYIENSKHRYTTPGVKVRVKRYATKRVN
ncbi:uncharacterized protein LOC116771806 [Danaus plexippus]|uniref:uncharacterized protein LOC116771806 n=1 Tax=Danaus plexippus TaxID=13037 RepID=UPI002AAF38C1|nr:uncharacterized protein LOC116771806 [Danaus plexippus]